jgi:hypothetical protein
LDARNLLSSGRADCGRLRRARGPRREQIEQRSAACGLFRNTGRRTLMRRRRRGRRRKRPQESDCSSRGSESWRHGLRSFTGWLGWLEPAFEVRKARQVAQIVGERTFRLTVVHC